MKKLILFLFSGALACAQTIPPGVGVYSLSPGGTGGGGSGTVTVVGGGSLTSTALVTGGGTTTVQTPAVTATMDSSGNISTPGSLTTGAGGSAAGYVALGQGTAKTAGTTNITLQAPTSVTSYVLTLPGAVGAANTVLTDVAGNGVLSWAAGGSGSVANPTGTIGLTAVNGSASSAIRSDGAPALSQAIAPTWTGVHIFSPTARSSGVASYFTITTPSDTNQTLSTESIGLNKTAATRQWATGALATQREVVFAAPTYGFVGASTLTTAINVDIADPVAGTNATLTNKYGLRVNNEQVTGTLTANTGTNLIGGLVDAVDGTTPLNNVVSTYASGTVYSLTATSAAITFGTTSPSVTIPNAGTYLLNGRVNLKYNAATFAASRTVTLKLRRTNNTAADLTNGSTQTFTAIITTITATFMVVTLPPIVYTTANTNDAITIFADVSVVPTAGSLDAAEASVSAARLY